MNVDNPSTQRYGCMACLQPGIQITHPQASGGNHLRQRPEGCAYTLDVVDSDADGGKQLDQTATHGRRLLKFCGTEHPWHQQNPALASPLQQSRIKAGRHGEGESAGLQIRQGFGREQRSRSQLQRWTALKDATNKGTPSAVGLPADLHMTQTNTGQT